MKRNFVMLASVLLAMTLLVGCGKKVEVPPAHTAKVMTKDGYQEGTIAPSKFRLPVCWAWCDKLVLLNTSDQAVEEKLQIFIPEDKLNLDMGIRVTLSIDPKKTDGLFKTLSPTAEEDRIAVIAWDQIYKTYAQQIVLKETREYVSKFSIAETASSLDKMNAELSKILTERIQALTPFTVRFVGITNIKYPAIITEAQEKAAERREQIQQEEAQVQIAVVKLGRELKEAQLQRQIEVEKAETEANRQRVVAQSIDPRVLELRRLENESEWIAAWKQGGARVPETLITDGKGANLFLRAPGAK